MTTKTRTKRTRSDSAASAITAMANAALPDIKPPAHVKLTKEAMPFWKGIISARARDEWGDVDLVVAAQLAQCQADFQEEDDELRKEGRVGENARGTSIMNPRVSVLEQLARREMALMRTLKMGGRAAGDPRDQQNKRKLEADSKKARQEIAEENEDAEDLLAT